MPQIPITRRSRPHGLLSSTKASAVRGLANTKRRNTNTDGYLLRRPLPLPGTSHVPDDDETLDEQEVPQEEQEVVEDLRYQAERRSPLEVHHQQPPTWQEIEQRGKDLQRQGQVLMAQAKAIKRRADLEKEIQKDEKVAEEALERAEKSRKRLRELK